MCTLQGPVLQTLIIQTFRDVSQPVDRRRGGELGGTQLLDEVAAPDAAGVLGGCEDLIDPGESSWGLFGHH